MEGNTAEEFIDGYERAANSRNFDQVSQFLAEDALFWFSDGSYRGLEEIRNAFERTWDTIQNENYSLLNRRWLLRTPDSAICIYTFRSEGIIDGANRVIEGRGTTVLGKFEGVWKIVHEHLSVPRC